MPDNRAFVVALALAFGALPLTAAAQWQWVDKDGRKVFSDKAPPPDVPARSILKQPGVRGTPVAAAPEAAASAPQAQAAASAPKVATKDRELEDRRKQAQAAEADKKKAAERELQEQQAENCRRAREAKAPIDSGIRLSRVNANGEREIMDDAARAAEAQRLAGIIARDCKPAQ